MKTLVRHIETLLLSNDCVIIPEFGGFVAHHVEAYYDEQEHLFIPPKRTIGFNAQLKMNDSLLAQSYAESNDLSYPEACQLVESKVERLELILENEGGFDFPGLGHMSINQDGNKEFTPFESGILTPELYGLGFVDLQQLSLLTKASGEDASAKIVPLNPSKSSDTISIKKSTLRAVAAACIALMVFFALPSSVNNSNNTTANFDISSTLKLLPKSISTNDISLEQTAKETDSEAAAVVNAKDAKTENKTSEPRFGLVLASRITKKNAEEFVALLNQKGFAGAKVLPGKNIKVVYGSFATADKAYEQLRQLHGIKEFKDAWVLQMKD